MPGDLASNLRNGKIDNIIVDTSEEPTFNNESEQECPDIVNKGVATGGKCGDRFGNISDTLLMHESVKTIAKTRNVTVPRFSIRQSKINRSQAQRLNVWCVSLYS